MNWPTSEDFNEAVRSPASFADPSLQSGEAVLTTLGVPALRRGTFADVYKFTGGDGKTWALKCFTRQVSGLAERYQQLDVHIDKAKFPFTVGFSWLTEGIRVGGAWHPLVKMEWAEGVALNEFVREHAGEPARLQTLLHAWRQLCSQLRDGGVAHGDLVHGNVLLSCGAEPEQLDVKLIDYDGMYVPALAEQHSREVGHPNYQHPFRLRDQNYSADLDRLPHLVIACALRATMLDGQALWDQFDTGDNLLFTAEDLRDPGQARVFKTLWETRDPMLRLLLGHLALASREPLRKTPWLDDLLSASGEQLTDLEEKKVAQLLGVGPRATALPRSADPAAPAADEWAFLKNIVDDDEVESAQPSADENLAKSDARRGRTANVAPQPEADLAKSRRVNFLGAGIVTLALIAGVIALTRDRTKSEPSAVAQVAQAPTSAATSSVPAPIAKENHPTAKLDERPTAPGPSARSKQDPPVVVKKDPPVGVKKDPPVGVKKDPPIVQDPPIEKRPNDKLVPPPGPKIIGDASALARFSLGWKTSPGSGLHSVVFAEDGKRLYVLDARGLRTLNAADGVLVEETKVSEQLTYQPVLGPDQVLLIIEQNRHIIGWDLAKKARRFEIAQPTTQPLAVNWKEGTFLVAGGNQAKHIGVYSLKDGKWVSSLNMPIAVMQVAVTPDGQTMAAFGGWGLAVKGPDRPEFKTIEEFPVGGEYAVALADSGKHVALYRSQLRGIHLHDLTGGAPAKVLEVADLVGMVFTRDGRGLLTLGRGGALQLWDVASGRLLVKLPLGLGNMLTGLTLSPDGRSAVAYGTNTLQLVHLGEGKAPEAVVKAPPAPVVPEDPAFAFKELWKIRGGLGSLAITPDGKQIALQTTQADIQFFDLKNGAERDKLTMESRGFGNILLGPDGGVLMGFRGPPVEMSYWERHGGKARWSIEEQPVNAFHKAIAVKANVMLMALKESEFGIFSLTDGKLIERIALPFKGPIWALSCTDDGEAILIGSPPNTMFFRAAKNEEFKKLPNLSFTGGNYPTLQLAPDGKHYMESSFFGPNIKLYKIPTGQAHIVMNGPANVHHALFTPDGQHVLSIAADATMRLWSVATGKEVARVALPGRPQRLALSPDGCVAVTSSSSGNLAHMQAWSMPDASKLPDVVLRKASPVRIKLEEAKQAYLVEMAKCRKAADEHFEQREEAALKDKMLSLLDQIEAERKDLDAATGLPKTSPPVAAQQATAAIARLETAFASAVKECGESMKDEAAALGLEFDEFKRARVVRPLRIAP